MNEQTVVYPYNGILLRKEKEWIRFICTNVNESLKYIKWKKLDTKAMDYFISLT